MIDIPLFYLGKRDYVNGLTIFEEMLKSYQKIDKVSNENGFITSIKSFKINRFIRSNCFLEIKGDNASNIISRDVAAQMHILTGESGGKKLLLFEQKRQPVVEKKEDYDRSIYIEDEYKIEDGIYLTILNNISDTFSLVRGVVEANYRYCMAEVIRTGASGRPSWAYLTNFKWPDNSDFSLYKEVKFKDKSTVHHNGKCHLIRRCSVKGLNENFETEICFFFNEP